MNNLTPTNCARLYSNGLTMREIAHILNTSISSVNRCLKKSPVIFSEDYYRSLVNQSVRSLKDGEVCYCFTEEQVYAIYQRYPAFECIPNSVGYTLRP
jgi:IS30 family transposase